MARFKTITLSERPSYRRPKTLEVLSLSQDGNDMTKAAFLVDGTTIKDVTFGPKVIPEHDADGVCARLCDMWPLGDWTRATVGKHPKTEKVQFLTLTWLPPATRLVYGYGQRTVNLPQLSIVDQISDRVRVVTCSLFPGRPLIYKFCPEPEQNIDMRKDANRYTWLKGGFITPVFVAHVSLNDKIIGFITEHISGHPPETKEQKKACLKLLKKVHSKQCSLGLLKSEHFLVMTHDDGTKWDPTVDGPYKARVISFKKSCKRTETTFPQEYNEMASIFEKELKAKQKEGGART